jgi:type I restriction enzyme S subunit
MNRIDRLEATQNERETSRDALRSVSLHRLTAPEDKAADVRFFLEKSPRLITKPVHVATVRQTIFDLAVLGRLTPQNPAEESAEAVLRRAISLPSSEHRQRKILRKSPTASTAGLVPPLGWALRTVQQLYDVNAIVDYADGNHGSLYPRKNEFGAEGIVFVTAKDLVRGRIAWESCAKLDEARARRLMKGWAKGGDVLLTHNATVGRVARVEPGVQPFLLGTSVTFYRLNPEAILANYFYLFLQSSLWQDQLKAIMAQTTRNQVSIQKQAELVVLIPPVEEQSRIATRADELVAACNDLESAFASVQLERSRLLGSLLHDALEDSAVPTLAGAVVGRLSRARTATESAADCDEPGYDNWTDSRKTC